MWGCLIFVSLITITNVSTTRLVKLTLITVLTSENLEVPYDEFVKHFCPAFDIAVFGAQGQTWDWTYAIAEWDRFDNRIKYTSFSRSKINHVKNKRINNIF